MKILAILQNQWFKNPDRMKRILERSFKGDRESFIRYFLFHGCLSGRRLRQALGEELCKAIVWEEASTVIGAFSGYAAMAEVGHIVERINTVKPDYVVTFGKIAERGLISALKTGNIVPTFNFLNVPHPAARTYPMRSLCILGNQLREAVKQDEQKKRSGGGFDPADGGRERADLSAG